MCASCGQGKYKESQGDGPCTSCDAGSYSLDLGATSQSTCIPCEAGKYSRGADQSCADCPANSVSPAASDALSDCTCAIGYTGANGATCDACAEGTYKRYPGPAQCTECGAGKYSAATGQTAEGTCAACPANSDAPAGSGAISECICDAGFTGSFTAGDVSASGICQACVAGKYKAEAGDAACTDCGAGKYSAAVAATAESTCSACPANSDAPAGSGAVSDCTCVAGFTAASGICEQ